MTMRPNDVFIQTSESVRGLNTFDPEAMMDRQHFRRMSREERHIRMRSLSPAPNHLMMRSRSRSRCGSGYAASGDDFSPYQSTSVSRGRSPAPATGSVRDHVRELSRGRSPSNVEMYSSRDSLRVREKSPLARKLEKEGFANVMPNSSHRKGRNPNRDSGYGDDWLSPSSAGEAPRKSTSQNRQKPPRSPRSSHVTPVTPEQARKQDWDELKKSPEVQRRKKEQKIHQDTQKSLEELRIQRRSPPSTKREITSAVNEAKNMPVVKKNYNYGACLDQPIPPMIRANDYVEVNTDDMNIVIKDFSPIRINRNGDRLFSMTVETAEKNNNGRIKRSSNNIDVKLSIDKQPAPKIMFGDNPSPDLNYRQVINYVRFSAGTPPQLWKQLIQNFQKFAN
jgi:hypothetical protein